MGYSPGRLFDLLTPEVKLAVICSSPKITAAEQRYIEDLLAAGIDWNLFLHWTMQYRVFPQVCRYFQACRSAAVPDNVYAVLNEITKKNNTKTLKMMLVLTGMLKLLGQSGIHVTILKGFPMAYRLYGDVTLRPSLDIDIMVAPQDFDKAREIIEEQGFTNVTLINGATGEKLAKWMKAHHNFDYWHEEAQVSLELHWRLASHGIDIPNALVESSRETMNFAGQSVTVLGKEVLLLYLISHGAGHVWCCLQWLRDIDAMVRRGLFSWSVLYELADNLAARHFVDQALILARDLLDTPLPEDIASALTENKRADDLAFQALRIMTTLGYRQNNLHLLSRIYFLDRKYRFALLNGKAQKMAYVLSQVDYYLKEATKGLGRRLGIHIQQ